MSIEKDRIIVRDQCMAIAHLANQLAQVHAELSPTYAAGGSSDKLLEIVGSRCALYMEWLGDALNAMDAVEDVPEWVQAAFEQSQQRWPKSPENGEGES